MASKFLQLLFCTIFSLILTVPLSWAQGASQIASGVLANYKQALSSKSSKKIAQVFHPEAVLLPNDNLYVSGRKGIAHVFSGLENIDFEEDFEIQEAFESGELIVVQTENRGKWANPENTVRSSRRSLSSARFSGMV